MARISGWQPGLVAVVVLAMVGCDDPGIAVDGDRTIDTLIPSYGETDSFDVGTYNLNWFGSRRFGPPNETKQRENIAKVIGALKVDLWGVQEVISKTKFTLLVDSLSGYDGLIASDDEVEGHDIYDGGKQKVGIIYRKSQVDVVSARVILLEEAFHYGGRPPLEVALQVKTNDADRLIYAIIVHGKAGWELEEWERRRDGAEALADYLVAERAGDDVLVIGDYNDDLDESIRKSEDTPFESLVDGHFFATWELAMTNTSTLVGGGLPVDHTLATGDLADAYRDGSVEVFHAEDHIDDYRDTTSDHLPVMMHFDLGPGLAASLVINEVLADEPGSDPAGEFVELVNPGDADLDLGGATLADELEVRHQFPAGTVLPARSALVISGGQTFGSIALQVASTGGLSLNNAGDEIRIRTATGATLATAVWGSSPGDGISLTRALDSDAASDFVAHDSVSSLHRSPGKRTSGAAF